MCLIAWKMTCRPSKLSFSGYVVLVDVILLVLLNGTLFSINLFIDRHQLLLDCLQDSLDFVVLSILMCIVILISR